MMEVLAEMQRQQTAINEKYAADKRVEEAEKTARKIKAAV